MAIIQAFAGAIGGTFADQWKEVITAGVFDAHSVVAPGVLQQANNGRGVNSRSSSGIITRGSRVFVPENTAAFVFSQGGIETFITQPGGYEYQGGQQSVFAGDSISSALLGQMKERIGYGGQSADQKHVAFVNLREIRGVKFGTRRPIIYHDRYYGVDLELTGFGQFSLRVVDPAKFVQKFVPPNTYWYTFDSPEARQQLIPEFLQAFTVALTSLSATHRISELPAQAHAITAAVSGENSSTADWADRFGLEIVSVGVEAIELTPDSRALVQRYTENKMSVRAYDGVSQESSNMATQQQIAQGIQRHGLGDGAGMIFGMNYAQGISAQPFLPTGPVPSQPSTQSSLMPIEKQVETIKQLKELVDSGILSEEEFAAKKKEIMGL